MTSPQDNHNGALQDLLKKAAGSGAQPLWQRYPKRFLAGGAIAVLALALLLSGGMLGIVGSLTALRRFIGDLTNC